MMHRLDMGHVFRAVIGIPLAAFVLVVGTPALTAAAFEEKELDCLQFQTLWPYGDVTSVASDGSRVFFGIGDRLLVGGLTASQHIEVLSTLEIPSIKGIMMAGTELAVRNRSAIRLVDISDGEDPVIVGEFAASSGATGMAYADQRIYVASTSGLQIVDVSDPAGPHEIGSFEDQDGYWDVAVVEGFAYAVSRMDAGLDIIDVSDPADPRLVGHLDTVDQYEIWLSIAVENDTAFIANDGGGGLNALRIVDVSDPANPRLIATYLPAADPFRAIGIYRNHLFLAESFYGGVHVVDILDPHNPVQVEHISLREDALGFAFSDNLLFIASRFGLEIKAWEPGAAVSDVATYTASGPANRTAMVGELVAIGGDTLRLVQTGAGNAHADVGRVDDPELESGGVTRDLVIEGNTAYWLRHLRNEPSVYTVDVSDPENPTLGNHRSGDYQRVAPGSNYMYLVGSDELTVMETRILQEVGSVGLGGVGKAIAVQGFHAFVLVEERGLVVADISEPKAPAIAASLQMSGGGTQIVVDETTAFVAGFDGGLRAVDISDPRAPTQIGLFATSQPALDLEIVGTCAIAVYSDELVILDVTDPDTMTEKTRLATTGENGAVAVGNGLITLAQGDEGVALVQMADCGCEESPIEVFIPAAATGPGFGTSRWSTDVVVNNPGETSLRYEVRFMPRDQDNSGRPADAVFSLEPGSSAAYPDIVNELEGASSASGAIRFDVLDGGHLLATSRTMSTAEGNETFGQGIPLVRADDLIGPWSKVRLLQLSENQDFRTNIGFMSACDHTVRVRVEYFSSDGVFLGNDVLVLKPYAFEQWNRALRNTGDADISNAYVDVWSETEGAAFFAYASVVDETTNDPTFIQPEDVPGSMPP